MEEEVGESMTARQWKTSAATSFADLNSIGIDMNFVNRACEELLERTPSGVGGEQDQENGDDVVARALWSSALVSYARCFSHGKRTIKLTVDDLESLGLEGEVREFHEWLLSMRNKHVAHSVSAFEMSEVGIHVDAAGEVIAVGVMSATHVGSDRTGIGQLQELARRLLAVLAERTKVKQDEVLAEARDSSVELLRKLPHARMVAPGPEKANQPR